MKARVRLKCFLNDCRCYACAKRAYKILLSAWDIFHDNLEINPLNASVIVK